MKLLDRPSVRAARPRVRSHAPHAPRSHAPSRSHAPRSHAPHVPCRRDQFLLCVFSGALARDLANDTTDAQLIARAASEIPAEKIPPMPINAAKVFLNYCWGGRTDAAKWMFSHLPEGFSERLVRTLSPEGFSERW